MLVGHVDHGGLGVGDGLDALGQGDVGDGEDGAGSHTGDVDLDGLGHGDGRGGDHDSDGFDHVHGAGGGGADDSNRNLDVDALVAVHQKEVDVLHARTDGVALHVLGQGQEGLAAVDVQLDQGVVVVAQGQAGGVLLEQEVAGLGTVTVDDDGDLAGAAGLAGRALAELGAVLGLEGDGVVGHEALLADEAGPGAPRLMVVRLGATTRSTARYHHVDHGCAPSQGTSLAGATWARLRHGRTLRTAGRRWGASPAATSRGGLDDVDTTSCDHDRTDSGCHPGLPRTEGGDELAHRGGRGLAGARSEGDEARYEGSDLWKVQLDVPWRGGALDTDATASAGDDRDRHTGVAQSFDVAGNGPLRHTQLISEMTEGEPVRAGMQSLDEVLLALHPPQGQVWVT